MESRIVRSLALTLLALASGACILLVDFDHEGLPCDADGACLPGYVCDGSNICVKEGSASAQCSPACGPFEDCIKSQCVPHCNGRACAAGERCEAGSCVANPQSGGLGDPCRQDSDCLEGAVETFCLRPYGGGPGVCTTSCVSDANCGQRATVCKAFSGAGPVVQLCVTESFQACTQESDCAASGLSCGVYQALSPAPAAVTACREPIDGGRNIGEPCSLDGSLPCTNGLCVRADGNSQFVCTAPCGDHADCSEVLAANDECAVVTVQGSAQSGLKATRASLCVPGRRSLGLGCQGTPGVCRADAPHCVEMPGETGQRCFTACADQNASPRCPSGMTCVEVGGNHYCQ